MNRSLSLALPVLVITVGVLCGYVFSERKSDQPVPVSTPAAAERGLTSIGIDPNHLVYLGGPFGVRVTKPEGEILRQWPTSQPVSALALDSQGIVYAAYERRVEKFDSEGKSLLTWGAGGCEGDDFGFVTGIAVTGDNVFVADAGSRAVYRFDSAGTLLNTITGKGPGDKEKGFILPGPNLDCDTLGEVLYVNNPGRMRVETYDFTGNLLGSWGQSGIKEAEFPGCDNPTNLAVFPDGRVAVSQKGQPCVKVFDSKGVFLACFGQNQFSDSARGIDLAVDKAGRIYAIDPLTETVHIFETQPAKEPAS